jgi:hypothetical protein
MLERSIYGVSLDVGPRFSRIDNWISVPGTVVCPYSLGPPSMHVTQEFVKNQHAVVHPLLLSVVALDLS